MSVYTVLSEISQPKLREAIEREFPAGFYHWSDTVSFVQGTGTAQSIALKLGIKTRSEDGSVQPGLEQCFVMRSSPSYYGWSKSTLWEWLKTSLESDG